MNRNLISVIIATYNRCETIKEALESISNQQCDKSLDYETIVVDNNSKDKTKKIVESYMSRFNGKIKYLFEAKRGKSYALNTAIKEAKGKIIAFTDDDTILPADWLHEINNAFKRDILLICGKVLPYIVEKNKIPKWCSEKILHRVFGCVNYGEEKRILTREDKGLSGMNMFVKKEVFNKVGYFNTRFLRGQDTDFYLRALDKGITPYYFPTIKTYHKIEPNRLTKKHFRYYHYVSGKSIKKIGELLKESKRNILNIPLWVIKGMFLNFIKSVSYKLALDTKESFKHQLEFIYLIGMIKGIRNYAKSKYNNSSL